MNVLPTKKFARCQAQTSAQPSEQAVARPSSTQQGATSSERSSKVALIVLSSLVFNLQREVLSQEVWYLAISSTLSDAVKAGVTKEEFKEIMTMLEASRKQQFKSNPLSALF